LEGLVPLVGECDQELREAQPPQEMLEHGATLGGDLEAHGVPPLGEGVEGHQGVGQLEDPLEALLAIVPLHVAKEEHRMAHHGAVHLRGVLRTCEATPSSARGGGRARRDL
jgi:hypothetical protein